MQFNLCVSLVLYFTIILLYCSKFFFSISIIFSIVNSYLVNGVVPLVLNKQWFKNQALNLQS